MMWGNVSLPWEVTHALTEDMDWQAEWALYHLARLDEHFAERLGIAEETEGNLALLQPEPLKVET